MARRKFDIDSLPSNDLEPRNKDISIVTTGRIKTRTGGGLANEIRTIGNSLFAEIIMPAMKSAVLDFFNDGLRMAMFGRDSPGHRGGRHTSYNKMHERRRRPSRNRRSSRRNIRRTEDIQNVFDDIFFDQRNDAELVLGRMMELIADYGQATVGDLYSLVGLSPDYTSESYGWENLRRCRVQHTSEGYVIDFPNPHDL